MTVYTSGDWHVKAGQEDDFAKKWHELSAAAVAEIEPSAWHVLLCDREDPKHFRSFGRWQDEDAIVRWRDSSVLGSRVGELSHMLESAETSVFEIADSIGSFGA